MLATVRDRRSIISAIESFHGGTECRLDLVTVEYADKEVSGVRMVLQA
ncbi:MAG: hypothetical protein AB1555_11365 [Nitrospirota bacterium]